MSSHNYLLKFIFTLIFIVVLLSSLSSHTNEKYGYLKIATDSSGIEIQLDNKLLGFTPLPVISLLPGTYQVTALHPRRYLWGAITWQDQIEISPDDTVIIKPQIKSVLSIQTQPFDADVFLNDVYQGQSPLVIAVASKDSSRILIKKEGYEDYIVDLQQVNQDFLNVCLIQNKQVLNLLTLDNSQQKLRGRYRALTYSLWGLYIVTGLTTIYLKDQADEKYRQYLEAGSLREMNKYYRDAKKFDRYTNVSLGAVQTCFLLSFYFLIKSVN